MKKLLLLVFMSIMTNVNAQWWKPQWQIYDTVKYVVMYELALKEDTTNLNRYKTENYMLSIGANNISSYRGYNSYLRDVEWKKLGDEGVLLEQLQTGQYRSKTLPSAHKFDILKNHNERLITTFDHIYLQGMYEYEEHFDAFNWQITSETDTIHNYVCQKAICDFGGRTWEAWFTQELTFSDGPYKFCGLPGLILNIADTQNHYSWKFLSIENPSEPMPVYNVVNDRTSTTKEGFFKLQKKYKVSHSIGETATNNDFVQKAIEYERSRNNPIERF